MGNLKQKKTIAGFIDDNSYLELDGNIDEHYQDQDTLHYSTRCNGSVGEEEYSEEDYAHAVKIEKELLGSFGDDIVSVEVDTTDEWVNLSVKVKRG